MFLPNKQCDRDSQAVLSHSPAQLTHLHPCQHGLQQLLAECVLGQLIHGHRHQQLQQAPHAAALAAQLGQLVDQTGHLGQAGGDWPVVRLAPVASGAAQPIFAHTATAIARNETVQVPYFDRQSKLGQRLSAP